MEEAAELADYLPLSFKTPKEQESAVAPYEGSIRCNAALPYCTLRQLHHHGYHNDTLPSARGFLASSAGVGLYTFAMNGASCLARNAVIFGRVATKCSASCG